MATKVKNLNEIVKKKNKVKLEGRINKRNLKKGLNVLGRSKTGTSLVAFTQKGTKTTWAGFSPEGKRLSTKSVEKPSLSAKTRCYKCVVDENGNATCWEVPCSDLVDIDTSKVKF